MKQFVLYACLTYVSLANDVRTSSSNKEAPITWNATVWYLVGQLPSSSGWPNHRQVFLRKLEYFEGVLFLTGNLVSNIDTAFHSRIDIHFEYPDLDKSSRLLV